MFAMLRKERRFSVLLTGHLLSQVGDGVHEFVFIITVLHVTHANVAASGAVYFFRFIPYVLLGPLGGALSDRWPRRSLMIFADLARMTITLVLCGLLSTRSLGVGGLAVIGMAMTALRTVFQPAFQGAIPSLVRTEHLPAANGATQTVAELGGFLGPALGGTLLYAVTNPGYILVIDAATYLVSALCIRYAIGTPSRGGSDAPAPGAGSITLRALYRDFASNLKAALGRRDLFVSIGYSALCILFVGAALRVLIPTMLKAEGFVDSVIGYAMSLLALGAVAGALLCGNLSRDFSTASLMTYWRCYGFMLALLPLCAVSAVVTLAGCFLLGAIGAFVDVVLPTNIQRLSTQENVGKNFSLFSTLANTGEAMSGAFAGALSVVAPVSIGISVIGVIVVAVGYLGGARSAVRHG
ncbi:MFS transporter [Trinickia dabaoshanensis]|uniref:MFS transporter n=1 Tax=Trinickia dabaoshanensis TaxID=564714 RepID=A0A2N7VSS1_9BURK|nr:MFS transporter [Trinickia dabaoshanensis]PMS20175.1 MFS transporter [Trinickia dabaoshanensis]